MMQRAFANFKLSAGKSRAPLNRLNNNNNISFKFNSFKTSPYQLHTNFTTQVSNFNFGFSGVSNIRYFSSDVKRPTRDEIEDRLLQVLLGLKVLKFDVRALNNLSHFKHDLYLDSLDVVEIVMAVEDEFCIEIPDEDIEKFTSVPTTVSYLYANPHIK